MSDMALLWCLLVTLTLVETGLCEYNAASASRLKHDLLSSYDPMIAPEEPLQLRYGISPVKIVDVDTERGLVTVDLWLKHQWIDSRLVWNSTEYSDVNVQIYPQDAVYVPETELYNGIMTLAANDPNVVVYPMGMMVYFPAVRAEVYCNIPPPPFQNEICPIVIGPWAHDVRQTNLTTFNPTVDHSFTYNTGRFSIEQSTAEVTSSAYECCPGLKFATMTLYLNLTALEESSQNGHAPSSEQIYQPAPQVLGVPGIHRLPQSSLPLILTPCYLMLLFLLPAKPAYRIFLGLLVFMALLLLWTSGVVSPDREGFMLMSICMTVAATCVSLVPCVVSAISQPTNENEGRKLTMCKARMVRMFDVMMLAAVAVVLGISTAGLYA